MALADLVEERLGLTNISMAIVIHRAAEVAEGRRYWLSLAVDRHPAMVRALRRCFPRRRTGEFQARMGSLGDLELAGVDLVEIDRAIARFRTLDPASF